MRNSCKESFGLSYTGHVFSFHFSSLLGRPRQTTKPLRTKFLNLIRSTFPSSDVPFMKLWLFTMKIVFNFSTETEHERDKTGKATFSFRALQQHQNSTQIHKTLGEIMKCYTFDIRAAKRVPAAQFSKQQRRETEWWNLCASWCI